MRLRVFGTTSDGKGTQLEQLTSRLLRRLGYRDIATNVIGSGGSEVDVRAELQLPSIHVSDRIHLIAECKASDSPIVLVSIARSKPTAFQAVSFEPPDPRENRRDGGISAKRARGLRLEVSHDLVHKVSEEDTAREDSRACARPDTADLRGTSSSDRARLSIAGSHPPAAGSAADTGPGKVGAVQQRAFVPASSGGIPRVAKTLLGPAYVGPRKLLRDGGRSGRGND